MIRVWHIPSYLGNAGIGRLRQIGDRHIDTIAVGCGAPLDTAKRRTGTDLGMPGHSAVIGIECPVDATLLADADDIEAAYRNQIRAGSTKVIIRSRRRRAVRPRARTDGVSRFRSTRNTPRRLMRVSSCRRRKWANYIPT